MDELSTKELAELRKRVEADSSYGKAVVVVDGGLVLRMVDEIERRRLEELLDKPETAEEKAALDPLSKDPAEILRLAKARATKQKAAPR